MVDVGIDLQTVLPENYEWYREQIAGHNVSVIKNGEHQIGLIKKRGSKLLLKPVQKGLRGIHEVSFYEIMNQQIIGSENFNEILAVGSALISNYYGLSTIKIANKEVECLVLEDLTDGYKNPCVIDIKIGKVTSDPNATSAKRASEAKKYPDQKILGFRLLGYRLINYALIPASNTQWETLNAKRVTANGTETSEIRDKDWGRSKNVSNVDEALGEFLSGRKHDKLELIDEILNRLYKIQQWFLLQRVYHIYASSILIGYEGCLNRSRDVRVKMIDFSHVFPANNTLDWNYLHGLGKLIETLKKCKK